MKLLKKQKELLALLVKGKGQFKTPTVPKDHRETVLDDLVKLYLAGFLTFQREYNVPFIGPSNEHKVNRKWYVVTIDKNKTIKDLKKVIKDGKI
tara:strand:+ start:4970 stop:5251 length:282 start_codon:yes stop_codon:yes gene_type:complete